ncbi:hypothetical protein CBFG_03085 [Clostridiales bacterium 1_7_47FAA]|nr:hypothetical protein CBFG_03085 [Clostridiales bacterium 1_7_47FAA]
MGLLPLGPDALHMVPDKNNILKNIGPGPCAEALRHLSPIRDEHSALLKPVADRNRLFRIRFHYVIQYQFFQNRDFHQV